MANAEERIVQPYERCIVAIKAGERYLGTGFVIDKNLALTCLHVVNDRLKLSLENNGDSSVRDTDGLDVEFYALDPGNQHRCRKLARCYVLDETGDVALLEWEGGLPKGVSRAELSSLRDIKGREVQTRGHPEIARNLESQCGDGTVDGTTDSKCDNGNRQLWTLQSPQICPGFSGAPLVDKSTGSVVGMVRQGTLNDRAAESRNDKTAVAIGCRDLRMLCRRYVPILQDRFASEHEDALDRLEASVCRFLEIEPGVTKEIENALKIQKAGGMAQPAKVAAKAIVDAVTKDDSARLKQLRLYLKQKIEQLASSRADADLRVRQALSGLAMRVVALLLGNDDFIREIRVKVFKGATVLTMPSKSSIMVELIMSAVDGREPVLLLSSSADSSADSFAGQRFKGRREIEPIPEEGIIQDEKVAEEVVTRHMLKELRVEWQHYFPSEMPEIVRQELRDAEELKDRWYMVVLEHDGQAEQSHSGETSVNPKLAESRKRSVDPRIVEYLEKEFGTLRQIQKKNLGVAPRGVTEWMGLLTSRHFYPPEILS
jgi:hypothetical protein